MSRSKVPCFSNCPARPTGSSAASAPASVSKSGWSRGADACFVTHAKRSSEPPAAEPWEPPRAPAAEPGREDGREGGREAPVVGLEEELEATAPEERTAIPAPRMGPPAAPRPGRKVVTPLLPRAELLEASTWPPARPKAEEWRPMRAGETPAAELTAPSLAAWAGGPSRTTRSKYSPAFSISATFCRLSFTPQTSTMMSPERTWFIGFCKAFQRSTRPPSVSALTGNPPRTAQKSSSSRPRSAPASFRSVTKRARGNGGAEGVTGAATTPPQTSPPAPLPLNGRFAGWAEAPVTAAP
mmetsp:Transcript_9384/g.21033  ORF Transcript_9384/g.21033 Transcript_9384/m.21033 type:complete len:298 (+) Transcript_9384:161-1054(+)